MGGGAASGNQFMNNSNNNSSTKQPNSSSPKNGKSKSDRKGQSGSGDSNSPTEFGTVKSAISSTSRFNNSGDNNDFVSQVSPMRSDFHFYAEENKDAAASIEKEASKDEKKTAFQSVTELNERLMEMWEKATNSQRTQFMAKEEADRERFMNEDEIESRHCATLTSRTRPLTAEKPERVTNVVTKDEDEDQSEKVSGSKRQGSPKGDGKSEEDEDYESPTKKVKEEEKDETTDKDSS